MRTAAALGGGVLVALLLFLLMHALVGGREGFHRAPDTGRIVDFVRIRPDEIVHMRERQIPREPPAMDEPPPPPALETEAPRQVTRQVLEIDLPQMAVGLSGGPALAASWRAGDPGGDADVIPIVRIEPQYPREAVMRGIEGWVRLHFTINPDGSVSDPVVIAAEPPRIFNREAMRAILRWKFRPRIVDGQAVSREAEQIIEFRIAADEPP